jgi:hypothetical protein
MGSLGIAKYWRNLRFTHYELRKGNVPLKRKHVKRNAYSASASCNVLGWPSYAAGKQADVSAIRFGPHILCQCLCKSWSGKRDSNPRPSAWKADALAD